MRVLLVGGSGYVGGLVLPGLAQHHRIRIFDLVSPPVGPWEYIRGDVTDPETSNRAIEGMDSLIYLAKGSTDDDGSFKSIKAVQTAFDVSLKGLYLTLQAASEAGISHAVYASTMSIYHGSVAERCFPDEDTNPDAREVYGFTKGLGEAVCRFAVSSWGMSVNALRLCLPISNKQWRESSNNESLACAVAADDLAQALLAALDYHEGFQAFMIGGDHNQAHMNLSKARRLLNWKPQPRVVRVAEANLKGAALNFLKQVSQRKSVPAISTSMDKM